MSASIQAVFLFLFSHDCLYILATIPILVAPVITTAPDVIVNFYTEAIIVCNVTGYPTPDIKWIYDQVSNQTSLQNINSKQNITTTPNLI